MSVFKNKPLLNIFLESEFNVTRTESNKTPIDTSKIDYSYDSTGLPKLRKQGTYWGGGKKNLIDFQVAGTAVFADRANADIERIKNYMTSPTGLLFNIKQTGLYLMNPKMESKFNLFNERRIFNPFKFMSNIAGKSIGLHKENHGLLSDANYYDIMKNNNNSEIYTAYNRLIRVYVEKGYNQAESRGGVSKANPSNDVFMSKIKAQQGISELLKLIPQNKAITFLPLKNNSTIKEISGWGGPKSIYGLGFTNIRSAEIINPAEPRYDKGDVIYIADKNSKEYSVYDRFYEKGKEQPGFSTKAGGNSMTVLNLEGYNSYQTLSEMVGKKWTNFESKKFKEKFIDKFQTVYTTYDSKLSYNENWNYFTRLGIPELGSGNTDVIYGNEDKKIDGIDDSQDFVKLVIGGIQFRCTIEGITYNFTPNWSDVQYIGRADKVKIYEGLDRSINFNFIVVAQSENEMRGIYLKLNRLTQLVSPDVSSNGLMTGQVVDLKIGNLLSDNSQSNTLPVVIKDLSFDIGADYPWDIIKELPMIIKVTISFDIIGNKSPNSNNVYIASNIWNNFGINESKPKKSSKIKTPQQNNDETAKNIGETAKNMMSGGAK